MCQELKKANPGSSMCGCGGKSPSRAGHRTASTRMRASSASSEAGLISSWRADRRSRVLHSLDWTRYHLWVYFVDALEPSYAKARLCRFFFERVCTSRRSSALLYCAAGGVQPAMQEETNLVVASAVPGLHASDLQNIMVPPYTFSPSDASMYDVIVATDERTLEAVQGILAAEGKCADLDHLCLLEDFIDAYDVLLAAEEEEGWLPTQAGPAPGFLTLGSLQALSPGTPLRGAPQRQPVGPPLANLPQEWEHVLWSAAGSCNELSEGGTFPPSAMTAEQAQRAAGRMLRSVVGLERALKASIPQGMRWWNDEE